MTGITGAAFVIVQAAPAVTLQIRVPSSVTSDVPFAVTVVAMDPYGNIDPNYTGTVRFSTSDGDPGVMLPPAYTFQPNDRGQFTFAGGATLFTVGDQTLTVIDPLSGMTCAVVISVGPGG
jgi:hypothetical protein